MSTIPRLSSALLVLTVSGGLASDGAAQGLLHHLDGGTSFPSPQLGYAVSGVGDVNHDGFEDFVVGEPDDATGGAAAGRARVVSGLDPTVTLLSVVGGAGDWMGHAVSGAGDYDADGYVDVIVGAPKRTTYPGGGHQWAGFATVVSGQDGSTLLARHGPSIWDHFGWSVSDAGDVDADGFDDVIVGASGSDHASSYGPGYAEVLSGKDDSVIHFLTGGGSDFTFGWAVAGAVDVDADGRDDVIVGAPREDGASYNESGRVWVFSGKDASTLHLLNGRGTGYHLGYSVAGLGDVDADGRDDFVVGEPLNDTTSNTGAAIVVSGKLGGVLHNLVGDGRFGHSVAGADDVNGDGWSDLIVGSPETLGVGGWSKNGRARVFSGLTGTLLHAFDGLGPNSNYGWSVGVGDVNGNGLEDVIVGGPPLAYGVGGAVDVYSAVCGTVELYGFGCPGSGGLVPILTLAGCATPLADVQLTVANGRPDGTAFLLLGLARVSFPLGAGCTLLVAPVLPLVPGPLPLSAHGSFQQSFELPPGTTPATITMQAFVGEPLLPLGYSTTQAVALTIE